MKLLDVTYSEANCEVSKNIQVLKERFYATDGQVITINKIHVEYF